jgi:ubiquinone/menaquinone biosynthesis C-methylase UbiE
VNFFPDLTVELRDFCKSRLAISPWLIETGDRFDPAIFEILDLEAREYAASNIFEKDRIKIFGTLPIPERLFRTALYEIMSSTAVLLAHEQTGQLEVNEEHAKTAIQMVNNFIQKYDFATLLQIYGLVTSYENQNALAYYGLMPEREFLLGSWHRPWIDYNLSDELLLGVLMGNYQIVIKEGRRYVKLTDQGQENLKNTKKILKESGFLAHRLDMLHLFQFNLFDDFEKLAEELWPESMMLRRSFIDFTGIKPGMKVLELGCANGLLTFEGGLADRVGPEGRVISIDPSPAMIARAEAKRKELGIDWVEFYQGKAEELPFEDESFDAVIGFAFLHFTDCKSALEEMRRVTRYGGTIASFHPLKVNLNVPFFQEWFSPILELAAKRKEPPKDFLFHPEEVPEHFRRVGLKQVQHEEIISPAPFNQPEKVVQHYVQGLGWFQEELGELPWRARQEIIETLKKRGREVCNKFPKEELFMRWPAQRVKAQRC